MRRPHGGHVLGASPQIPFTDDLTARQGDLVCPQDQLLDLRTIQRWYQSGALKGGLWLPDWAYQEQSAGTAVTTTGQVVGNWLDCSMGLAEGTELLTNGYFHSESMLPWSNGAINPAGSVTRSIESGRLKSVVNTTSLIYTFLIQLITGRLNGRYIFRGSFESTVPFRLQLFNNNNFSNTLVDDTKQPGTYNLSYTRSCALTAYFNTIIGLESGIGSNVEGGTIYCDNLSVREILGNHATQTTTANKPLTAITPITRKPWMTADSTDVLPVVFPTSLGSACTIARANPTGVTFDENQTISTTWNNIIRPYQYNSAVLVADRQLTAREKAVVSRVLGAYVPGLGNNAEANPAMDADSGWTKGAGWSIGSEVATKTAGTASNLSQDVARAGIPYHVTADITRTAGTIGAANGTMQQGSVSASGTLTQTIVATGTTIGLRGDSSFAGTADNVRIMEIA